MKRKLSPISVTPRPISVLPCQINHISARSDRRTILLFPSRMLRGVLFIVRAGGDIIKVEFMHTKRTNCLTKMKIGIHLEELK